MTEGRICSRCGSPATIATTRFCGYCGCELPENVEAPASKPLGPYGDLEPRFEALRGHPRADARPRRSTTATRVQVGNGGQVLFGIVFTGIALTLAVLISGDGHGAFLLFPLLFVPIGIGFAIRGAAKTARFSRARTRRVPSLVVDERTEVSGGEHTSTTYYATLQSSTGRRFEYEVSDDLAGHHAAGDMGFAEMRAGHLLDFERVDV